MAEGGSNDDTIYDGKTNQITINIHGQVDLLNVGDNAEITTVKVSSPRGSLGDSTAEGIVNVGDNAEITTVKVSSPRGSLVDSTAEELCELGIDKRTDKNF